MWINYAEAYQRQKLEWELSFNRELSFKEWVNTVKQLGMMHILYWRLKEFELNLASLGVTRLYPSPAKTFYNGLKREKQLISALDTWEKEYNYVHKHKLIKQHNNA
jgi:hypothetical protein